MLIGYLLVGSIAINKSQYHLFLLLFKCFCFQFSGSLVYSTVKTILDNLMLSSKRNILFRCLHEAKPMDSYLYYLEGNNMAQPKVKLQLIISFLKFKKACQNVLFYI